jgi:phosphocarrier protein HPr
MIRRSAHPETTNATSAATLEAGFVNPWAECWGSGASAPQETEQLTTGPLATRPSATRPANDSPPGSDGLEIGGDDAPCLEAEPVAQAEGSLVRVLPIINHKGLHARASARFVQTVEGYDADVRVTRCGETVGGLSIMGLMMLAAARGTTITVQTSGKEAQACMAAIEALLADKFGEEC